jgi:tetratricopeptide (TPR) repeat protein
MKRFTFFLFPFFLAVVFAFQWSGLSGPWMYDSAAVFEEQQQIFSRGSMIEIIRITPQRPLAMLTFYLNFLVTGMSPWGFRVLNLCLLAGTALLAYGLFRLLLTPPLRQEAPAPQQLTWLALFGALACAIHPLQTHVTLYVWQRTALMAEFFGLAALLAYFAIRTGRLKNRVLGYAACLVLFACAMLSKENTITVAGVVIVAEIILFRSNWRRVTFVAVLVTLVTLPLFAVVAWLQKVPLGPTKGLSGMIERLTLLAEHGPFDIALTQLRIISQYMLGIVSPFTEEFPFVQSTVVSTSLLNPPSTLVAAVWFLIIALLLAVGIRRRPVASFGMIFFLVTLLPETCLIPHFLFFWHRAALPMFGIVLVVLDLVGSGLQRTKGSRAGTTISYGMAALAAIWMVATGMMTLTKSSMWADPVELWRHSVEHLPPPDVPFDRFLYVTALSNLGYHLHQRGQDDAAIPFLRRAIQAAPRDRRSLTLLASALAARGREGEAEQMFTRALQGKATDPRALVFSHVAYGTFLERTGRPRRAIEHLEAALAANPGVPAVLYRLGKLHLQLGEHAKAASVLDKATRADPSFAAAHWLLGQARKATDDREGALRAFRRVTQISPAFAPAWNSLGLLLLEAGDAVRAQQAFSRAIDADADSAQPHYNLGNAYMATGDPEEAVQHYKAAVRLQAVFPEALHNMGAALERMGRFEKALAAYEKASGQAPHLDHLQQNVERLKRKLSNRGQPRESGLHEPSPKEETTGDRAFPHLP